MSEETSIVPVDTQLSKDVQHAVHEATGELFDKIAKSLHDLTTPPPQAKPQGYYADPFSMLDSIGMGYRANPTQVTYETLRQMSERNTLIGSIVNTRNNQMSTFCQDQENKYSVGHLIRFRDKNKRDKRLTNGERDRVSRINNYVQNMGTEPGITRDGLVNAMKKMTRDTLTYDQVNFENVYNRGGKLHETLVMDAATIRIADQTKTNPRGIPLTKAQERTHVMYVQLVNGEILREFTPHNLAFGIRNPRSSLKVGGYGFPEPQILIQTVTAHIWAEEWNRKAFSQGSTIKGVLNMKGNIDRQKYEAFKRQWMAQVGGIVNAWKTPIINSDGIEFMPMQMSNTEMGYQMWIEYLVKIACAIYQMDPSEINFDLRGGTGQQPMFMGNNEAQQKLSKDRGLKPLLRFFEDLFNRNVIHRLDEEFELAFVGLDAKSEEQAVELQQKKGMTSITINELRALDNLGPVPFGDVVANPTYIGYRQNAEMMQQQQGAGGGAQPPQPGQQGNEDEEPADQPYGNRFGDAGDAPSPVAKQAGAKLSAMAGADDNQDETHEDDEDIRMLRRNDWSSSVHASLDDNDLFKSPEESFDDIWKSETSQKGQVIAEGPRGGKIIGHTKSGKPIYQSFIQQQEYGGSIRDWDANDHHDAIELHTDASQNSEVEPQRRQSHKSSADSHKRLVERIYSAVAALNNVPQIARATRSPKKSPKKLSREERISQDEYNNRNTSESTKKLFPSIDEKLKKSDVDHFEIDL